MMSSAHNRGSGGFENTGTNAEPNFEYRIIRRQCPQTHALHYVDMNGDGRKISNQAMTGSTWESHLRAPVAHQRLP